MIDVQNIRINKLLKTLIFTLSLTLFILTGRSDVYSQDIPDSDTLKNNTEESVPNTVKIKKHSPKKAALYSAILPGLGQAYNKKYWKIPIIYAGVGTLIYFINLNNKEYKKFRDAYTYVSSGDSSYTDNEYVYKYSESALLEGKNYYKGNLELTYILSGVLYILNIIDATVDAHLFEYDISDKLSLKLEPAYNRNMLLNRPMTGVKISLRF